jgi:hypothetical protein
MRRAAVLALSVAVVAVGTGTAGGAVTAARGGAPAAPALRYIYSGTRKVAANGWNLMDVGPSKSVIDRLSLGTRALVWVGDYNNRTCAFEVSESD